MCFNKTLLGPQAAINSPLISSSINLIEVNLPWIPHSLMRQTKPTIWPQGPVPCSPCLPHQYHLELLSSSLPTFNAVEPSEFLPIMPYFCLPCTTLLAPCSFLHSPNPASSYVHHPSESSSYVTTSRKPSWIPQTRSSRECLRCPCILPICLFHSPIATVIPSLICNQIFNSSLPFPRKEHSVCLAFLPS